MYLTKTHTSLIGENLSETSLAITVDYDPDANNVKEIVSAVAYNHTEKVYTDLTDILYSQFGSPLELMAEAVRWDEVYAEEKAEKREIVEQE